VSRYLVAGGAGFIGSNIVEALLKRGDDVSILDDFSSGRRENLEKTADWSGGADRSTVIEGDMRDARTCAAAVDGAEFVIHLAAVPSVQRSVENPLMTNDVNVAGTLQLLEAARQAGVQRFVFASSSSLYGESETLPKIETMAPDPISPYGLQKLCGETYCRLYYRLYGLPTIALRYFNVFGPRQNPRSQYAAVIPLFIEAAKGARTATVFGDGEQTRDFTYVDNVIQANLKACEAPESACGSAYNIACGDRISLNQLLIRIGRVLGCEVKATHERPRPGDIRHSLASIDLAAQELGYRPEIGLDEGLGRTAREL
jgi:nucleoside-diphosphate-sugar epimerase